MRCEYQWLAPKETRLKTFDNLRFKVFFKSLCLCFYKLQKGAPFNRVPQTFVGGSCTKHHPLDPPLLWTCPTVGGCVDFIRICFYLHAWCCSAMFSIGTRRFYSKRIRTHSKCSCNLHWHKYIPLFWMFVKFRNSFYLSCKHLLLHAAVSRCFVAKKIFYAFFLSDYISLVEQR